MQFHLTQLFHFNVALKMEIWFKNLQLFFNHNKQVPTGKLVLRISLAWLVIFKVVLRLYNKQTFALKCTPLWKIVCFCGGFSG